MISRGVVLVTTPLVAVASCGAPSARSTLVSPVLGTPPTVGPITLRLPEVQELRAPSGLTVHLVSRPDSMVGHLALRTSPRALLSRPHAALDRLIVSLLSDRLEASVSLDRRGLQIDRDVGQDRVMRAAAELLSLGIDPRWNASSISGIAASQRLEQQQTPALLRASVVRRFFGMNTWEWEIHSPDAAVPNPSPDEVRARLAELLEAEGSNLVIVTAANHEEMRSQLETALGTTLALRPLRSQSWVR